MKIYLDDMRAAPDTTWKVCHNSDEFRSAVTAWCGEDELTVSFDHDLGDDFPDNGYTLIKWLCDFIGDNMRECGWRVSIGVHSANPVGAKNIRDYWEWYIRMVGQ